ncbi:GFA family protein [Sneathiella sp. P13V-1]|uniref:GFA family protein n=1 Tax=Sneathiella sp. P13V-1 TaxID=2697366 RepID=UPI00187B2157|nr:GFA family protein [Sneathiella sp. P13V-1]MBE7635474.1 GFA family protein [Sneathiella sp. P13V-1]
MSIIGQCHCGTVRFRLDEAPRWLTECNCSACRKLGALWIYSQDQRIILECEASDTLGYSHGDRNIAFHSCILCGCTTHWEGLKEGFDDKIAVNARLLDPKITNPIKIRHFDGADTFQFLD